MKSGENNKPPRIMLAFFRWFCAPNLLEETEGDLLEHFHKRTEQYGLRKARVLFIKEVILLFRPGITGNIYHLTYKLFPTMKKLQWLQLIALNLLVVLCIFLPFMPGTS
ncbi:MAG: permease prefix domain 2-containing transporter [Chitinophagaceae bacterium]